MGSFFSKHTKDKITIKTRETINGLSENEKEFHRCQGNSLPSVIEKEDLSTHVQVTPRDTIDKETLVEDTIDKDTLVEDTLVEDTIVRFQKHIVDTPFANK